MRSVFLRHAELLKNSGAMAIGAGFTSVFGFAFWWFAARTFSPEVIGGASAIISLIGVVSIIGDGGLSTLVVGESIRWPARRSGLIAAAMIVSVSTCLLVGALSLPLTGFVMGLPSNTVTAILLVGCVFTAISNISDQAWTGMLQSTSRMLRLLSCSVLRLIFVIIFAIWFSDALALLIIWFGSLGVSLAISEWLMRRNNQSFIHRPDFDLLWRLKQRVIDHYMLDLGMMLPAMGMPYVVAVLISATSNAAFTVIWLMIGVGSLIPSAMATVLFPAIRAAPHQYHAKMRLSLSISLAFSIVFALALWVFSTFVLGVFNPHYVQIAGIEYLGLLGFGLIGSVIRYHLAAAARLNNRMRQMSRWVFLAALFEVAAAAVGSLVAGLAGLCIGWTVATAIEGMVMWVFANPCVPPLDADELRLAV